MTGTAKRLPVNVTSAFGLICALSACGLNLDEDEVSGSKKVRGKAGSPDVHINEVVASNHLACADEKGKYPIGSSSIIRPRRR